MRIQPMDVTGKCQAGEVWTVGHSTLSLEALFRRLVGHRIERVADVRRYPASRRHPHVNRETISTFLGARGLGYRWFEALGGRRRGLPRRDSPNDGWRDEGFRRYADYALTPPFAVAFVALVSWSSGSRTAIMCAEADWRRCHRRLLADRFVKGGWTVWHIRDETTSETHEVRSIVRTTPAGLVYPPRQSEMELET